MSFYKLNLFSCVFGDAFLFFSLTLLKIPGKLMYSWNSTASSTLTYTYSHKLRYSWYRLDLITWKACNRVRSSLNRYKMSCMRISLTINVYTHCHNRLAFLFLWPAHMKTRHLEFVVLEYSVSPLYLCILCIVSVT